MKALETENARLRKAIADLTLDKLILQEAARGNLLPPRAPARRCRAHPVCADHLRASHLPGARSAPLDPAQSAAGQRGRATAHGRPDRTRTYASAQTNRELTFNPDHPMGADHGESGLNRCIVRQFARMV